MESNNAVVFDNTKKYIELGYNIAYYRKHAKLTQEQLAEKLGISRQHLGAIEAPNLLRPVSLELLFLTIGLRQPTHTYRVAPRQ